MADFTPAEERELLDLARHAGDEAVKAAVRVALLGSPAAAPSVLLNAATMLLHVAAKAIVTRQTLTPVIDGKSEHVTAVMHAIGRGIANFPDSTSIEAEVKAVLRVIAAMGTGGL